MIDRAAAHVYATLLTRSRSKPRSPFSPATTASFQAEAYVFNAVVAEMQDWRQEIQAS